MLYLTVCVRYVKCMWKARIIFRMKLYAMNTSSEILSANGIHGNKVGRLICLVRLIDHTM